ncbi:MAG: XdhC family protein, partial [Deltaproteobacteria bacterium]|nr:XdhC family protein [Deltaproteobacteria bacterium]
RVDACIATDAEGGPRVFYQPFNPPLRMIVVGAVHIAQSLSTMAALTGYEVIIVDPRESFAAADRFPGVTLNLEWPDAAMESLALDQRCAVVTLTHDPKLDDPALQVALAELARVKGPVGLPIGSRSPAEIAVSVLAQVTETLRKPAP